jgi:hypothetical protein
MQFSWRGGLLSLRGLSGKSFFEDGGELVVAEEGNRCGVLLKRFTAKREARR